jgi:Spy/CpxP family protein refolding chaperone
MELTSKVLELESQLEQEALQAFLEVKKILTPTQLQKLPIQAFSFLGKNKSWRDLNLTQHQLDQLHSLNVEYIKKGHEPYNKIYFLASELRYLILQPGADEEQIEKITQELAQARKESAQLKTEFLIRSRDILMTQPTSQAPLPQSSPTVVSNPKPDK